jgi:hypothetical protein
MKDLAEFQKKAYEAYSQNCLKFGVEPLSYESLQKKVAYLLGIEDNI